MPGVHPINRGLNVAFLTHRLSREGGGLQTSMLGLSSALNDSGAKTSAIGITDKSLQEDQQTWAPTTVYANPLKGPTAFGYSPAMQSSLNAASPHVVHQHGLWTYASVAGQRWCRKQGVPRIISPHNMLDSVSMGIGATRKIIATRLYENRNLETAGSVHALVEKEAKDIRALGYTVPICVIPNGIDVPDAGALPESIAKLQDGSPYLLYLSRLTTVKKVLDLIAAWQKCTATVKKANWKLIIAGWGTETMRKRVQEAVELAGSPNLHFIGPVFGSDKDALFGNASAFALPSSSEGLPMAVLESLAHGTPVMITEQCNLPDVVPSGAGFNVEPEVCSIAKGINTLLEMNQSELKSMRTAARALVEKNYSWKVAARQFLDVYEWLAGGGTRPDSVRWLD